ncbi:hypothetical protein FQR65_LT10067 [Abscondita terminalis]|nr:hypothetical protein FQR65_LT10067 [Abscondita terminalis]
MNVLTAFSIFLAYVLVVGSKKLDDRIIGGDNALPGEFPYQVSFRQKIGNINVHICSGSVISEEWSLTAAHCVSACTNNYVVVLGSNKLNSVGEIHQVVKIRVHDNYDSANLENDVTVVKFQPDITFFSSAKIIPLRDTLPPNGANCIVSGWGLASNPSTELSNDLKRVYVNTISLEECRANLTDISVFDSNLCARSKTGYGVCTGDSGSPLKYLTKQIGIASFGMSCGDGRPDVYSSVPFFKPWITEITGVV